MYDKEMNLFSEKTTEILSADIGKMDRGDAIIFDVDDELAEVMSELEQLKKKYSEEETENLVDLCEVSVMSTIVGQFGLASLFVESKDGGNVSTLHNAKKQIFSNEEDREKYNRVYNSKAYHGDNKFYKEKKKQFDELSDQGELIDVYTGKNISGKQFVVNENGTTKEQYRFDLEHIFAGKQISDKEKARLFMNEQQSADLANSDKNLAATAAAINRSKGDKQLKSWMDEKSKFDSEKQNAEYFEIDKKKALEREKEAKKYINRELNKAEVRQYTTQILKSGVKDVGRMVAYSAIGVIIHDFALAIINELKFMFKNKNQMPFSELFQHFKKRIKSVVSELKYKWKDILKGSFEAGITAFLSNIGVFVINLFATTLKKIVEMIRAGFVSICNALKVMTNPPYGMTREDADYEAAKIIITGIIGALSLGLSACIEKFLQSIPGLQPLMMFPIPSLGTEQRTVSDALAVTLSAIAGGVVSTVVIYFMDKIRCENEKNKLRIQIAYKSQEALELAKTSVYSKLAEAFGFIRKISEDTTYAQQAAMEEEQKSFEKLDKASKDLDDIVKKFLRS